MKKIIITVILIFSAILCGVIFISRRADNGMTESENIMVGLIMIGTKDDKSYNQSHYDGLCKSAEALGFEMIVEECVPENEQSIDTMKKLIHEGCSVIICNSFGYGEYVEKIAPKYPDVYFYHAAGTDWNKNLASFFGRMYQIRYLSGIAAGLRTETNEIGYIAAFDIPEVNRGINAFTLGVRSVNPDAVVCVDWCGSWTSEEMAAESFGRITEKHDIDVIAVHTDALSPLELADEQGIWSIGYNFDNTKDFPDSSITSAVWQWDRFYTPQIKECMKHNFIGKHYWESIETGIAALAPLTKNAAEGTAELIEIEKKRISSGTFDVFYGEIKDTDGKIRIANGESMSDEAMLNSFDWYVEGVVINE